MRLRPTGLGAKGALFFAAVVLLFFATAYSNLFFLLTTFLGTLGALGATGAWRNLRGVSVELVSVEAAATGDPHALRIRVTGPRGKIVYGVLVDAVIDGHVRCIAEVALARVGETIDAAQKGMPRGVHSIEALTVRSRHPFGVCMATATTTVRAEVIAHPRPAATPIANAHGHAGDGTKPPGGDEESIASLREWRQGDAVRHIHWKATARRGSPIVKEFERHGGEGVDLVIDRRCELASLETALSEATRCVLEAAATRQALRLRSQDASLELDADRPEVAPLLRWLASAMPLPKNAPPPPVASQRSITLTSVAHGGVDA